MLYFFPLSQENFCGHEWEQEENLSSGERQTSQSPQNSKLFWVFRKQNVYPHKVVLPVI